MEFIWDAKNTGHLARHKITPQEAEEAILLDCLELDLQEVSGEARVVFFGRTAAGRLLTIVYTTRADGIRVVTGYTMTKRQQRIYFQGR